MKISGRVDSNLPYKKKEYLLYYSYTLYKLSNKSKINEPKVFLLNINQLYL